MITEPLEYLTYLQTISNSPHGQYTRLPKNEPVYELDWNSRQINGPQFLGVSGDHEAEIIYFEMDRFYDYTDLADTIGIILFTNANKDEYTYVIPYYDIETKPGKIIFPWVIQAPVALYSGTVNYGMKFFKLDPTAIANPIHEETDEEETENTNTKSEVQEYIQRAILFELNTKKTTSQIIQGWGDNSNQQYQYATLTQESFKDILTDNSFIELIQSAINLRDMQQIYWIDVGVNS